MSRQQQQKSLVTILLVVISQLVVLTQCKTTAGHVGFNWYNGQARQSVYAHNCDFPSTWENQIGEPLAKRGSWSRESCSKKCVDTNECTHFVFFSGNNNNNDNNDNNDNNWCQLRSGKVSRHMATWMPGTQCGIVNQHPVDLVWKRFSKGVWSVGCNFLSGDVKASKRVSSFGECARQCAGDLKCTHFVFGESDSWCVLKESNKIAKRNAITFPQTSCGIIFNKIRRKPKHECGARGLRRFFNLADHSGLPAYALIHFSHEHFTSELFSGVLINPQTILISASFVENKSADEINVYLGLRQVGNVNNAVKMNVSQIIIHSDYDPKSNLNDIALLRLEHEVALDHDNEHIQIACLPELNPNDYPTFNSEPVFSRMMLINTDSLQVVGENSHVVRLDDTKCRKYSTYNSASQFCAVLKTTTNITQGESSKMVYVREIENGVEKAVLAGLLTSGDDTSGEALVYTRVSYFLDWIYEKSLEMEASNLSD